MQFTIDVRELEKLCYKLDQAGKNIPRHRRKALQWGGEQLVQMMKLILDSEKDTGTLRDSVDIVEAGSDYIEVGPNPRTAEYAMDVYAGRGPHIAPFPAILAWTERKLGGDEKLARMVWWSIYYYGTSVYMDRKYGTGGGFPYPEWTVEAPEIKLKMLRDLATRLGTDIIVEIVSE